MKQPVFYLLIICLFFTRTKAQNVLPEVPKGSVKSCEIKGTYIPRGDFAKKFPNFLKDGVYAFDKDYTLPSAMGLDYESYFFLSKFNDTEFPALYVQSDNTFKGFNRIVVKFVTEEAGVQFHLDRDNYIYNSFDVEYPQLYNLKADVKSSYDQMNNMYKTSISKILEKKAALKTSFSDLGNIAFNTDTLYYNDLILEFQYVQSNTWMQSKTADKFPSHSLYKLVVKDASGKTLQKYGQAVFFEGDQSKFSRPKQTEYFVFSSTFPPAAESLINQFLNDNTLVNAIKASNQLNSKNTVTNKLYANLLQFKSGYNLIKAEKAQLAIIGENVGVKLSAIEGGIEGVKQATQEQAAINSMTGNDVSGAIGGLISNMIMKGGQKKNMNRVNEITFILQGKIRALKTREDKFLAQLSQYLIHPSDLEIIMQDKDEMNKGLDAILANTLSEKANVSGSMAETYRSLNNMYLSNINTGVQYALQNSAADPTAVTSAISNGGAGSNATQPRNASSTTTDVCSIKSETEWKATAEYKKCASQTVVNTSQASCERAKAKLIEITLKNCRTKLPANEIKVLEQTRQQLLQRATEMDRGAFRMN